jgi:hypothetical protein
LLRGSEVNNKNFPPEPLGSDWKPELANVSSPSINSFDLNDQSIFYVWFIEERPSCVSILLTSRDINY